jgi:uncharacterized protein YybS (DUF2232 family)
LSSVKNKALTEGAFFAAFAALLGLIGLYVPPLYFFTTLLVPLPLAVLVRRHDLVAGLKALAVTTFLMFIFFGEPFTVLILVIQFGPLGLLLGALFKNHIPAGPSIAASSIMAAFLTVVTIALGFWITGINPFAMGQEMRQAMEQAGNWYARAGLVDAESEQQLREFSEQMISLLAVLLPGSLAVWALTSALLTYLIARAVFIRLNYSVPPIPPFSHWRYPWYSLWGITVGLGLVLAGDQWGLDLVGNIGANILYVFAAVFFVLGLSVLSFYLKRWQVMKLVKVIIIITAVLYWPFAVVGIITMGVLDPIFNSRRLPPADESGPGKE